MTPYQQDVQALDRILLRLGLTEEDKLSAVSRSTTFILSVKTYALFQRLRLT